MHANNAGPVCLSNRGEAYVQIVQHWTSFGCYDYNIVSIEHHHHPSLYLYVPLPGTA